MAVVSPISIETAPPKVALSFDKIRAGGRCGAIDAFTRALAHGSASWCTELARLKGAAVPGIRGALVTASFYSLTAKGKDISHRKGGDRPASRSGTQPTSGQVTALQPPVDDAFKE